MSACTVCCQLHCQGRVAQGRTVIPGRVKQAVIRRAVYTHSTARHAGAAQLTWPHLEGLHCQALAPVDRLKVNICDRQRSGAFSSAEARGGCREQQHHRQRHAKALT